jgi:hypothetical protein
MGRTLKWGEVEAQLSLAGVTLGKQSLLLEPQPAGQLRYHVPCDVQVLVDQEIGWLVWDAAPVSEELPNSPANRAALPGFIRLGDAHDSVVLRFARQWGPLGDGCRRALPEEFPAFPPSIGELVRSGFEACKVFEPLEAWRRLARQLEAMLRLAAYLQRGKITPWLGPGANGWDSIAAADPNRAQYEAWIDELSADRTVATDWEDPTSAEVIGLQRGAIAGVLHVWLKFGGVQLVPYWDATLSRMVVRVDYNRAAGLHGQLGLEIASALASPFGIVQCAGCGYPYAPEKRRPRIDRRAYCPECSDGTSLAAKRDWWRRNRSARRTIAPAPTQKEQST